MQNRIAKTRKEKGLTLKALGALVGLGDNTISRYETGKREPKLDTWQKLAEALDVSVPYLQGLTSDQGWTRERLQKLLENSMKSTQEDTHEQNIDSLVANKSVVMLERTIDTYEKRGFSVLANELSQAVFDLVVLANVGLIQEDLEAFEEKFNEQKHVLLELVRQARNEIKGS